MEGEPEGWAMGSLSARGQGEPAKVRTALPEPLCSSNYNNDVSCPLAANSSPLGAVHSLAHLL
jgi:hypothetical protein